MTFLETLIPHTLIALGFLCCTALWLVAVAVAAVVEYTGAKDES